MATLKDVSIETIRRLPDECSLEEIMYEINLVAQVLEGVDDAQNGRLITTAELLNRVEQWPR